MALKHRLIVRVHFRATKAKFSSAPATLAVVDLGSNSFRLEIGRVEGDQIFPLDTWRETLRLGAGMDEQGRLTPQAQRAALGCLARFRERLRTPRPPVDRVVFVLPQVRRCLPAQPVGHLPSCLLPCHAVAPRKAAAVMVDHPVGGVPRARITYDRSRRRQQASPPRCRRCRRYR